MVKHCHDSDGVELNRFSHNCFPPPESNSTMFCKSKSLHPNPHRPSLYFPSLRLEKNKKSTTVSLARGCISWRLFPSSNINWTLVGRDEIMLAPIISHLNNGVSGQLNLQMNFLIVDLNPPKSIDFFAMNQWRNHQV